MQLPQVPVGVSGYRGVHAAGRKGWRAVIEVNGVRRHLGYYENPAHAAREYDAAATRAWGSEAIVNFRNEAES